MFYNSITNKNVVVLFSQTIENIAFLLITLVCQWLCQRGAFGTFLRSICAFNFCLIIIRRRGQKEQEENRIIR